LICITIISCKIKTEEKTSISKIQDMLLNMKTYKTTAKVTYISNKNKNTYKLKQYLKVPGQYRIELIEPENVKDLVTICDGEKIIQLENKVEKKLTVLKPNEGRTLILLESFIMNYFNTEDAVSEVYDNGIKEVTVLEATIPGESRYFVKQKLWIDNKTLVPTKLTIYDINNEASIIVKYEDFMYNIELEDSLFMFQ